MADYGSSPEQSDKPIYTEKKCERDFRKLLETTNSPSPSKNPGCSADKPNEYVEKKCERDFRKLLETSNSVNSSQEAFLNKSNMVSSNGEKKCEREFRKLLESCELKPIGSYCKGPAEDFGESPYIVEKCEKKTRSKREGEDDSDIEDDSHYNNENAIPEKKRKDDDMAESTVSDDSNCSSSIASFSHFQKCRALVCGVNSGNLKAINQLILSPATKNTLSDLTSLYERLEQRTSLQTKCQSIITLSSYCTKDLTADEICAALGAINILNDAPVSDALNFCQGILLFTITKQNLNTEQIIYLESVILKIANTVIRHDKGFGNIIGLRMVLVKGGYYLKAYKLCQKLFAEKNLDIDAIDVLTLCCSALKNLSDCEAGVDYRFKDSTLKFILGMTGKATQEIVAENLIESSDDDYTFVSAPSHMVNQCLQIIEHMLKNDPDSPCKTLDHEDFSILHCLTRLLGWCMSYLFQKEQSGNYMLNTQHSSLASFHLSTLVLILKILSILSFNPRQYDSFTNIRGLMEKVMICILKAYFQSEENRFDVIVLALELMINFFLKNKRTFVLLCLKKFEINSCEQVLSIEALLKILRNSLAKINEIKGKNLTVEAGANTNNEDSGDSADSEDSGLPPDNIELVLEAADEDMELSTIVSFISILLVFFMDTKTSFVDFIRERLSQEVSSEAIIVSKKVLQFASLTGGMPVTGILLLRHAIKKLSRLYPTQAPTEAPAEAPIEAL